MNAVVRTCLVLALAFAVGLAIGRYRPAPGTAGAESASGSAQSLPGASSGQDLPHLSETLEPSPLGLRLIAAAWKEAWKDPEGRRRDSPEISALVGDLDQEALFRLLLERNGMRENQEGRAIEMAIARRLGELPDPDRSVAFILSERKINYHPEHLLEWLFEAWAGRDSTAALQHLEAIGNPTLKEKATEGLVRGFAQADPRGAAELYASDWGREHLGAHGPTIAAEWAGRDPDGALAWIAKLPNAAKRASAEMTVAIVLVDTDPGRALEIISPIKDRFDGVWIHAALENLARADPEAAFHHAQSLQEADDPSLVRAVLGIWATGNPRAAADFFVALDPALREANLPDEMIPALAEHAPAFLETWAGETKDAQQRASLYAALARRLAAADPKAALAMAANIDLPPERESAMRGIAVKQGQADPVAGLATAALLEVPAHRRRSAISEIATEWARRDPDSALHGIQALPPEVRASGITAVLSLLARSDPPQAANLFSEYLADPRITEIERDAMNANPGASALIFHALQFTDPAAAINLAFALPPGTARAHTLHSLHRSWSERDAPGADAALRSWNLTPEEREVFEKLSK